MLYKSPPYPSACPTAITMIFTNLIPALSLLTLGAASLIDDGTLQTIIAFTNQFRSQSGLKPICVSSKLMNSSLTQSQYQAGLDKSTHDGSVPMIYRFYGVGFSASAVGENLVNTTSVSIANFLTGLVQDPQNKANLQGDFTHMGVAAAKSATGKIYWTQLLGKASDPAEPCSDGSTDSSAAAPSAAAPPAAAPSAAAPSAAAPAIPTAAPLASAPSQTSAAPSTPSTGGQRYICVRNQCYLIQPRSTGANFATTSWKPPASIDISTNPVLI